MVSAPVLPLRLWLIFGKLSVKVGDESDGDETGLTGGGGMSVDARDSIGLYVELDDGGGAVTVGYAVTLGTFVVGGNLG